MKLATPINTYKYFEQQQQQLKQQHQQRKQIHIVSVS